jgi:phage-related protein
MDDKPLLTVRFFKTASNNEPVREWLKEDLSLEERKLVGEDIKTVQYGWPKGMPLVRKIDPGLWEVRTTFAQGIARTFFTVEGSMMILLHGIRKKSQKTELDELSLARKRLSLLKGEK